MNSANYATCYPGIGFGENPIHSIPGIWRTTQEYLKIFDTRAKESWTVEHKVLS